MRSYAKWQKKTIINSKKDCKTFSLCSLQCSQIFTKNIQEIIQFSANNQSVSLERSIFRFKAQNLFVYRCELLGIIFCCCLIILKARNFHPCRTYRCSALALSTNIRYVAFYSFHEVESTKSNELGFFAITTFRENHSKTVESSQKPDQNETSVKSSLPHMYITAAQLSKRTNTVELNSMIMYDVWRDMVIWPWPHCGRTLQWLSNPTHNLTKTRLASVRYYEDPEEGGVARPLLCYGLIMPGGRRNCVVDSWLVQDFVLVTGLTLFAGLVRVVIPLGCWEEVSAWKIVEICFCE